MPAPDTITAPQLSRLIGLPDAPDLLDVRTDEDYAADPRLLPASVRRDARAVTSWTGDYAGRSVVVACRRGLKLGQGTAAWLRHQGAKAEVLEDGFEAWVAGSGNPLLRPDRIPPRGAQSPSSAEALRHCGQAIVDHGSRPQRRCRSAPRSHGGRHPPRRSA